jgi:succinate dehydrogenase hydrophobic anchor subunit
MSATSGDAEGRHDDPEQRRPRSLKGIALIVGGVILVVLVIWLLLYRTASEVAEDGSESLGAVAGPVTVGSVTGRP